MQCHHIFIEQRFNRTIKFIHSHSNVVSFEPILAFLLYFSAFCHISRFFCSKRFENLVGRRLSCVCGIHQQKNKLIIFEIKRCFSCRFGVQKNCARKPSERKRERKEEANKRKTSLKYVKLMVFCYCYPKSQCRREEKKSSQQNHISSKK